MTAVGVRPAGAGCRADSSGADHGTPCAVPLDSTAILLRRIGVLEQRVLQARKDTFDQRRRAEMWRGRALGRSPRKVVTPRKAAA